ncbi:hypothetical protein Q5Y75_05825 [Ruegeria sp. 2205SS24-7]|uniref:hypothetical protein n=1 Tax=Ruegeria discodermiae TaxID=3064389 RepID=UPI002741CC05|nr:hypothetical protein [Ruegeria sp. 2205SS24-7]MDP5216730.1 hypothetical protein [Ruegeria sp. 2205SS24-7]
MEPQTLPLTSLTKKGEAAEAVLKAPDGWVCILEPPHRSSPQNNLSHKWYAEIAKQRGDTLPIDVKAECKGFYGVPILCAEDAEFSAAYDRAIRPLPFDVKIQALRYWPVTSLMNKDQKRRYLDAVYHDQTAKGFRLTEPEDAS